MNRESCDFDGKEGEPETLNLDAQGAFVLAL